MHNSAQMKSVAAEQSSTADAFTHIVSNTIEIMQGQGKSGWSGGPVPYSWGGGHGEKPGPTLGTCVNYTGKILPCPADHTVGVDCSGFTRWVYFLAYGKDILGRGTATTQLQKLQPTTSPQPGDLAFFGSSSTSIHHVGIYIGNGQMINAPGTGLNVQINTVEEFGHIVGYYRYNG
jgi:cell wall-associated NlpC family hydrolase